MAGTGNDLLAGASAGHDVFVFAAGHAGGSDTITGFNPATDQIVLSGYGTGAGPAAVGAQSSSGSSAGVQLADGTHILFAGMPQISGGVFVSS